MNGLRSLGALGAMTALLLACGDDTGGTGGSGGEGGASTSTSTSSQGGGSTTSTTTSSGGGEGGEGGAGGDGGGGGAAVCAPACDAGSICVDSSTGPTCRALRILTLEEAADSAVVGDMLETLGATVTRGPSFHLWDGTNPALTDIDAVVWFEGANYTQDMPAAGQTALAAFVAAGGGLVRTEYAAENENTGVADVLLPVTYGNDGYFGNEWTRLTSTPPIGASLSADFQDADMGFSEVTLKPNAVAVWADADGLPLVSYTTQYGGRVVHVNHGVTYPDQSIGTEMVTIFADSAIFAAGKH